MDKILVVVYVLSLEETYDVLLPINLNAKECLDMMQDTIVDLSKGTYQKNPNALLYTETGHVINLQNNVKFSGLTNGCKVLLK